MKRYHYTQTDQHMKSYTAFVFLTCSCVYIFQERRFLEETVTPLNPTAMLNQHSVQTAKTSSAPENNETERGNVPLQQNGQRREGNEDQHASKLHFFQGEMHAEIHTICMRCPCVCVCVCVHSSFNLRSNI